MANGPVRRLSSNKPSAEQEITRIKSEISSKRKTTQGLIWNPFINGIEQIVGLFNKEFQTLMLIDICIEDVVASLKKWTFIIYFKKFKEEFFCSRSVKVSMINNHFIIVIIFKTVTEHTIREHAPKSQHTQNHPTRQQWEKNAREGRIGRGQEHHVELKIILVKLISSQ